MAATELSDNEVATLGDLFRTPGPGRELRTVRKGAVIFKKGDKAKEAIYIIEGEIRMDAMSAKGKLHQKFCVPTCWLEWDVIIADVRAGISAPELGIVHSRTAVATMVSEIVAFPLTTFRKLRDDNPPLNALFINGLEHHIATMNEGTDRRIAREVIKSFPKDADILPLSIISPTRIADQIGVSRQTVHAHINRFRENGLVTKYEDDDIIHKERLQKFLATGKSRR